MTPDLSYDYSEGEEKKKGDDNKWHGKKKTKIKNKNKIEDPTQTGEK